MELLAWVIMSNHLHLVFRATVPALKTLKDKGLIDLQSKLGVENA
jgi:hypothetical protein